MTPFGGLMDRAVGALHGRMKLGFNAMCPYFDIFSTVESYGSGRAQRRGTNVLLGSTARFPTSGARKTTVIDVSNQSGCGHCFRS